MKTNKFNLILVCFLSCLILGSCVKFFEKNETKNNMQTPVYWSDFDALLSLSDKEYEDSRDKFLNKYTSLELNEKLTPYLNSHMWEERLQAYILLEWTNNRKEILTLLRQIDKEEAEVDALNENILGASVILGRKYSEYAIKNMPKAGLALAWEVIWKKFSMWPSWKKEIFPFMICNLPKDEFSMNMGFVFIREFASHDIMVEMLGTIELKATDFPEPRKCDPIDIIECRPITPFPNEKRVSPAIIRNKYIAIVRQKLEEAKKSGLTTGGVNPSKEELYFEDLNLLKDQMENRAELRRKK